MRFTENFDQHKLNYIIENHTEFDFRITDPSYDPLKQMKKYLNRSKNGKIVIDYHQAHNRAFGRWFADDSCSLQNLPREVRHTISEQHYIDIDIVNAHPVLLVQICGHNSIECDEVEEYVDNREKHIKDVLDENPHMTREEVKNVFLSLLNGGKKAYNDIKNKTKFLKRFRRQMTDILDGMESKFPDEYKFRQSVKDSNVKGSTLNAQLCEAENQCLMVIVDYFKTHERIADSAVLCFDGVMIPKNSDTIDLEAVQNVVKEQTSYSITLKVKPMDEGYMITKDIPEYNDIKAFDPDDSFTWLDFIEKYHGATFTSEENLLNSTIHDLSRVYAWVHEGSGYHIRKTDCEDKIFDMMDGCRKIPKLFFKIQPPDPKAKMKKMTFDQYVTEFLLSLNTYQSISFDPSCSNDRMFNLWTGYKAKESESSDFEGISLILKHLREVYCSDNTEAYEYFLTLLHTMLKYPNQRLGVATFLFSRTQGTGKNTFLDFLRDYVVGKQMTFECAGLDNVIKKFNSALKNKKLVVVDEIASSSETWHSNFDKMKTLITSESIQIEKKGVDMLAIKN